MSVVVCSKAAMFGDMLFSAIRSAGYTISNRYTDPDDLPGLGPSEALVLHITETAGEAVRKIRRISASSPKTPMIVLCPCAISGTLREQIGLQVNAVIPDDQHLDIVISSLTVVESGYSVVPKEQMDTLHRRIHSASSSSGDEAPGRALAEARLSKQELAIMSWLRNGLSNKEIANEMRISDSTVKVHLRSIYQKAGVKNRTQAALWASEKI